MSCQQCEGLEREFDDAFARRELRRYRKKGLPKATRLLVEALRRDGVTGMTLLDVGGGVGGIQLALLQAGARHVTSVDASSAYLAAAREEAERQGVGERVTYRHGDFVEVADDVEPADIVTLDRVVCCYPDMPALVGASVQRARVRYGLVHPRDDWWVNLAGRVTNLYFRLRRSPMRFFVHPAAAIDAEVRRYGFEPDVRRATPFWQVVTYRRVSASRASAGERSTDVERDVAV